VSARLDESGPSALDTAAEHLVTNVPRATLSSTADEARDAALDRNESREPVTVEHHHFGDAVGRGPDHFQRLDLARGLLVHLPDGGLPEVGDLGAWKASHEALRPDDL